MRDAYVEITRDNPAFGWWQDAEHEPRHAGPCTFREERAVIDPRLRAKYDARYPRQPSPLDQLRDLPR